MREGMWTSQLNSQDITILTSFILDRGLYCLYVTCSFVCEIGEVGKRLRFKLIIKGFDAMHAISNLASARMLQLSDLQ